MWNIFFKITVMLILFGLLLAFLKSCDDKNPYRVGMHMDYSVICEDGLKYKCLKNGIIPLKVNGVHLKCGEYYERN
jgi:hypothetical protein